jgi:hypothetical protein
MPIVYSYDDADGDAHVIPAGEGFTTEVQRVDTAEESALFGGAALGSYVPCQVQHRYADLAAYDDDLLARWAIIRVEEPDPEPGPPPRRLIRKSLVQERVNAIGKLGDAFAALNADPLAFGRWFAPDWPSVYADDEGLLEVLTGIGCTEEQIAAITAP